MSANGHGTTAQAPIGGGAGAGGTFSKVFGLAFVPKTPFLSEFRLRECFLKKAQGSSKAYYKGAKLHNSKRASEGNGSEKEDLSSDFAGVVSKDLGFDALGEAEDNFQEVSVLDEAEKSVCSLIAPNVR